jgi:hypothetical protein
MFTLQELMLHASPKTKPSLSLSIGLKPLLDRHFVDNACMVKSTIPAIVTAAQILQLP